MPLAKLLSNLIKSLPIEARTLPNMLKTHLWFGLSSCIPNWVHHNFLGFYSPAQVKLVWLNLSNHNSHHLKFWFIISSYGHDNENSKNVFSDLFPMNSVTWSIVYFVVLPCIKRRLQNFVGKGSHFDQISWAASYLTYTPI